METKRVMGSQLLDLREFVPNVLEKVMHHILLRRTQIEKSAVWQFHRLAHRFIPELLQSLVIRDTETEAVTLTSQMQSFHNVRQNIKLLHVFPSVHIELLFYRMKT